MFKTDRSSDENRDAANGPNVPKPHFRPGPKHFRNEQEFESWLDGELDLLEALYADFATNDSLRGYFER